MNSFEMRNITNEQDHSHALTIQYFEILQRYRTEVELAAAEPLLFLPFRPLEFTIDLIADYWTVLREGISDPQLRERFEIVVAQFDPGSGKFEEGEQLLDRVAILVQRPTLKLWGRGTRGAPARHGAGFPGSGDAVILASGPMTSLPTR